MAQFCSGGFLSQPLLQLDFSVDSGLLKGRAENLLGPPGGRVCLKKIHVHHFHFLLDSLAWGLELGLLAGILGVILLLLSAMHLSDCMTSSLAGLLDYLAYSDLQSACFS